MTKGNQVTALAYLHHIEVVVLLAPVKFLWTHMILILFLSISYSQESAEQYRSWSDGASLDEIKEVMSSSSIEFAQMQLAILAEAEKEARLSYFAQRDSAHTEKKSAQLSTKRNREVKETKALWKEKNRLLTKVKKFYLDTFYSENSPTPVLTRRADSGQAKMDTMHSDIQVTQSIDSTLQNREAASPVTRTEPVAKDPVAQELKAELVKPDTVVERADDRELSYQWIERQWCKTGVTDCTVEEEILLYYTPKLEGLNTTGEFMAVFSALELRDELATLSFRVVMASSSLAQAYQLLPVSSNISVMWLDGRRSRFVSLAPSMPVTDKSGYTQYVFQVAMNTKTARAFEERLIDQIAISWPKGQETYPVQNVDLYQRQIICQKNCKK